MPARNVTGGTALAGSLNVNATISQGVQQWAGSAAFAGAGGLAANTVQLRSASAAFAGVGALTATSALNLPASAAFAGAGSLAADLAKPSISAEAVFAGAGLLAASSDHFSVGVYDETGAATLSIAAAAFTELEFGLKLDLDTLQTGDVLSFRVYRDGAPLDSYSVTPSITVAAHAINATAAWAGIGSLAVDASVIQGALQASALFVGSGQFDITPRLLMAASVGLAGTGSLSVDASKLGRIDGEAILQSAGAMAVATAQWLAASARYDGIGSFAIQPSLWMRTAASFGGVGTLTADLTPPTIAWQGAAQFDGVGDLSVLSSMRLPTAVQLDGAGSFAIEALRFIPLSETFSGAGSFLVGDTPFLLASLASYSAAGSLSVVTSIVASRAEWLVCASISIAPELPTTVAINAALDGTPAMKVC